MKFIKQWLIAIALTIHKYTMPQGDPWRAWESSEELEPEAERDEWTRMMHHDDVTPIEQAMLYSDDPEQILQAQQQIEQRQKEFQAWWDDEQARKTAFYGPYMDDIKKGVKPVEITEHEGWEDDEDMPEYYETVVRIEGSDQGKVVKVPFELGEKLAEMLGPDDEKDEQFNWMFDKLVEVYNDKGFLAKQDYTIVGILWEGTSKNAN